MAPSVDRFLVELLQLPADDRGEIAARLLESLDPASDTDVEAVWSEEIRVRIEDVQSGRVTPVPWSEARQQIASDDDGDN